MSSKSSIAETVLSVIRQHSQPSIQLRMECSLFSDGAGLDSVGFLAVVISIEQALDITFDIQDLNQDTLSSVGAFVAHIELLRASPRKS
jgi:acyl carrier protein